MNRNRTDDLEPVPFRLSPKLLASRMSFIFQTTKKRIVYNMFFKNTKCHYNGIQIYTSSIPTRSWSNKNCFINQGVYNVKFWASPYRKVHTFYFFEVQSPESKSAGLSHTLLRDEARQYARKSLPIRLSSSVITYYSVFLQ